MKIDYRPFDSLKAPQWGVNYVLKPDMNLLRLSMNEMGWVQPIIARAEDQTIIDGTHRWVIAGEKQFQRSHGKDIPVLFFDCDLIDAMVMHIRLNRARGEIFAKPFAKLLKTIVLSDKYSAADLEDILVMSPDEVDLMLAGGLLKQRKIPQHTYSRAWVPVEAPSADKLNAVSIERPPNPDR
jgi:ParB-like chromosome segregation protein Spo0J